MAVFGDFFILTFTQRLKNSLSLFLAINFFGFKNYSHILLEKIMSAEYFNWVLLFGFTEISH